jgi:hypothetical protein
MTVSILSSGMICMGFACTIIWAAHIGGPRRTQLRKATPHLRLGCRRRLLHRLADR